MARKKLDYNGLVRMAKSYGVEKNHLFLEIAQHHEDMRLVMAKMRDAVLADSEDGGLTVGKEYVKGKENLCANPLLKEIPRVSAEINNTARTMVAIIQAFGKPPEAKDDLDEFQREHDG